jgi:DNA-binding GntR family transcriptional regulator
MAVQTPIARHHVREEIQRRILSGESQPGERLTQQSLAKELGVAQGTVRESLLELQWLGLVESVDRLGVFVGKLDAKSICEAYQVREFLEGLGARLACDHASRADIAGLKNLAEEIWRLAQENKENEMGVADRAFHLKIMNLSHNKILIRLAEGYRVLGMALRASRDPRAVHEEHLLIVDAIDHNFPDEAERLERLHVSEARRMIEDQATRNEFIPLWVTDTESKDRPSPTLAPQSA